MTGNIKLIFLSITVLFMAGCGTKDLSVTRQEAYQAYQTGDYQAASVKFEKLVQELPKDAELWFRLGNTYAKIQLPYEAIKAYRNALLRDPAFAKAWYNMGLIQLQVALKSYADMQQYVQEDDPVRRKGKVMQDEIYRILNGSEAGREKE